MRTRPSRPRRLSERFRRDTPDTEDRGDVEERRSSRRGRGFNWRKIAIPAGVLLVLAWLAPTIVAHTPLRNRALAWVFSDVKGSVTAEGASLGWFSPVILYGAEVRTPDGSPVLKVTRLEGTESLSSLITDGSHLGNFRMETPRLTVVLDKHGSNVEEVLAAWLKPSDDETLTSPQVNLELVDASISVVDEAANSRWQLDRIRLSLDVAKDWSEPMKLEVEAEMPQPDRNAQFDVRMQLKRMTTLRGPQSVGQVVLNTSNFPLAMLESLARGQMEGTQLQGWMSTNFQIEWDTEHDTMAGAGQLTAQQLVATSPALHNDQLRLEQVSVPCHFVQKGSELSVKKLEATCDVGNLKVDGEVLLDTTAGLKQATLAALRNQSYALKGQLDLARLANLLPETLRIREGTRITAGQLVLDITRAQDNQRARWTGQINASRLAATYDGEPFAWEKPIDVTLDATEVDGMMRINKLSCLSDFLKVDASGSFDQMTTSATYDLDRLAAELGRFVDLGNVKLAGTGWSNIRWNRDPSGAIVADGECQVRNFELRTPTGKNIREENLVLLLQGTATAPAQEIEQVRQARVELRSGTDQLSVELKQPVDRPTKDSSWPIDIEGTGALANWLQRFQAVVPALAELKATGQSTLTATLDASRTLVTVDEAQLTLKNVLASGPSLNIEDREIILDLAGQWEPVAGRADLRRGHLHSGGVVVDVRDALLRFDEGILERLSGGCTCSGDLATLQKWFNAEHAGGWDVAGRFQGDIQVTRTGTVTNAQVFGTITDLKASHMSGNVCTEQRVDVLVAGQLDRTADQARFDRIDIKSQSINIRGAGAISEVSKRRHVKIDGTLDYDSEKFLALIRPYVGSGVNLVAQRTPYPFSIAGPLGEFQTQVAATTPPMIGPQPRPVTRLELFTGSGGVGWTGLDVYGFRFSAGELRGKLREGVVYFDPLNLVVSDGRLSSSPRLVLGPGPAELVADAGPLVQKVKVSREMCNRSLKYVAPIVYLPPEIADAAQVQGLFSVDLEGCHIPLPDLERGEIAGRLTIHSIEAQASPLVQETVRIADLILRAAGEKALGDSNRTVRLKKESVVTFRMVDGRVYHRDLDFTLGDVSFVTHGSVGLDQTLAMRATIKAPKLFAKIPGNSTFARDGVQVDIGGTLQQPRIDERAITGVGVQALQEGVKNKLIGEVNKQFEKLFTPK